MVDYEILKYSIKVLIEFLIILEIVNYIISVFCRSNKRQAVLRVISFIVIGLTFVIVTNERYSTYNEEYLRYIENKNKCLELLNKNQ